ncbi:MAG TPA: DMT family transporter, partial [Patescibacteria group bacterium]
MLMLLRSFCGFIIFGIISFLIPTKVSQNEITSALPLLIINGILMLGMMKSFWLEAIHRVSVIKANAIGSVSPVITLAIVWIFMDTTPTKTQAISLLPIIVGLLMLNHKQRNLNMV